MRMLNLFGAIGGISAAVLAHAQQSPPAADDTTPTTVVGRIESDAARVRPLVQTDAVRSLLDAVSLLPEPTARTIWRSDDRTRAYSQWEYDGLPEDGPEREGLKSRQYGPEFFYSTGYGSPLIYSRPLDLVALAAGDDWKSAEGFKGKRILDFGYGLIGHLRLLGLRGAEATGVDVEPVLRALYSGPGDTGRMEITGPAAIPRGKVTVVHGRWPAEEPVARAVKECGGDEGYDLIISKNVLKRGYIHPAREVDERFLVRLGVSDDVFVKALRDALRPGGLLMIYNISPRQNEPNSAKPYLPHADGECPFPRQMLEKAGFEVLEFDRVDTPAVLDLWMALGINQGKTREEVSDDLFAWYTLARRKAE